MNEIASPLSYFVLQRRQQMGDLHQMPSDTAHRLHRVKGYRAFIADVDEIGDCARPTIEPARSSGLDLSLSPLMPFVNGKER